MEPRLVERWFRNPCLRAPGFEGLEIPVWLPSRGAPIVLFQRKIPDQVVVVEHQTHDWIHIPDQGATVFERVRGREDCVRVYLSALLVYIFKSQLGWRASPTLEWVTQILIPMREKKVISRVVVIEAWVHNPGFQIKSFWHTPCRSWELGGQGGGFCAFESGFNDG